MDLAIPYVCQAHLLSLLLIESSELNALKKASGHDQNEIGSDRPLTNKEMNYLHWSQNDAIYYCIYLVIDNNLFYKLR